MKVSILINNFNYGRFVAEAVESALHQSHQPVEVIVVDDGSTDDSLAALARFGDRIQLVCKPNGGQGSAFNAGLALATGELAIFLDADDILTPDCAAIYARHWEEGVTKWSGAMRPVDEQRRPLANFFQFNRPPDTTEALAKILHQGIYTSYPTSGNAFTVPFLKKIFPVPEEEFRMSADRYLFIHAPFYGKVVHLPEIVADYRVHSGSYGERLNQSLDLNKVRHKIRSVQIIQKILQNLSRQFGHPFSPENVFHRYDVVKSLIFSWKLDPAQHPVAPESWGHLFRLTVPAAFRPWGVPFWQRIPRLLVLWTLLCLPASGVRRLALLENSIRAHLG